MRICTFFVADVRARPDQLIAQQYDQPSRATAFRVLEGLERRPLHSPLAWPAPRAPGYPAAAHVSRSPAFKTLVGACSRDEGTCFASVREGEATGSDVVPGDVIC